MSFDLGLGEAIRASATEGGQSVSAWLADAARDRLRRDALGSAVQSWEKRFGPLTDDELAKAERTLVRAGKKRRHGAV